MASPRLQVDCFWADCSSRRQGAQYSAQRNAWLLSNVHLRLRCAVHLELSRAAAVSEANLSAGVARVENLVDTVSKTGFKGTPAFMSPEQLQVPAGSRSSCHVSCSAGCAGCPRDAQVRRLCVCRFHVGDGNADASVARPRNSGGTLCRLNQGRPTLPLGYQCCVFRGKHRWTMRKP